MHESHSTSPPDLAPGEDDKPYARQKRKRTSMEDQSVLEEAYKRDPKPDKSARLDIVRTVDLGEKEVQIWFQNRRQSSRRKTRPLLPHEVVQYQMCRFGAAVPAQALLSSERESLRFGACEQIPENERPKTQQVTPPIASLPSLSAHLMSAGPVTSASSSPRPPHNLPQTPLEDSTPAVNTTASAAFSLSAPQMAVASLGHKFNAQPRIEPSLYGPVPPSRAHQAYASSPGYLTVTSDQSHGIPRDPVHEPAQRRSSVPASQATAGGAEPARKLRKATSRVRLSMSFDGNASVVTTDGSSPSPPRAPPALPPLVASGQRSSMPITHAHPTVDATARSALQRTTSGRARDSRAWEFWCDKESRVELETKAEKDSNGSAADAISLLRSHSGRSILGALPARRNADSPRKHAGVRRALSGHHRPSLQRANTSFGRLQSKSAAGAQAEANSKPTLKKAGSGLSVYIPGNESDKENKSPGTEGSATIHHGAIGGRCKLAPNQHLRNGSKAPSQSMRAAKTAAGHGLDGENRDPEQDPELAAFMSGGRQSISSEDDLDCVQRLLSLSQGSWR
ncbi:Homeobox protein yox1 [Teratosphaeriaceae sp. CCFEE 6253]|nr:Homeobox protein yox1 [Teratosphaeriaceae sp. CCFEE 6253]